MSRCISHIAFTTKERYFPSGRPFYIGFLVKKADVPYGDLSEIRTHDYQLERLASYPFKRRDHLMRQPRVLQAFCNAALASLMVERKGFEPSTT